MKRRHFLFNSLASPWLRSLGMAAASVGMPAVAHAQFKIDVAGIGATQIPVAIAPFAGQQACPQPIADIIRADLTRSGQFRTSNLGGAALTDQGPPNFVAWRTEALVAVAGGSVASAGPNRWVIRFRLWDAVKQADMGGQIYQIVTGDLRLAAHKISDFIYQKLTGQRGVFATRIAYISKAGPRNFALVVADCDGENSRTALRSREPLLSPAWAPDGNTLAYVSFETGKPVVFTQNIRNGARRAVANFRGSNSAPAFSPDGRTMAVVLTLSGRSQIYLIPSTGGRARRLMSSGSIDTEPVFAPDGKSIYFVSDRDGSPQIYAVGVDGSGVRRLTFSGSYNVSPAISPDGKTLAFVSQQGNSYELWLQDLASGNAHSLSNGTDDGHPSFAPNGQIILYSAIENGAEVLKTVSLDGSVRTTLAAAGLKVREPSWGPWTPGT